ncbi:hypothetical protein FHG87_000485 [Trinorchestia longiramus]|nr:hypothetical protein FHG87_000485 [Trinorchestia longiramus]
MGSESDSDGGGGGYDWTNKWRLKKKQFEEDISRKNALLQQLMDDNMRTEEDNSVLRATVSTLQTRLKEALMEVDELATDYSAVSDANHHLQETLVAAQEREERLAQQLEQVKEEGLRQEQNYLAFAAAAEQRNTKLQALLQEREEELVVLKAERESVLRQRRQHTKFIAQKEDAVVHKLRMELADKNRELSKLTVKLQEATAEMDETSAIIVKLKESCQTNASDELKAQLQRQRKQLQQERQLNARLKQQLVSAEDDAQTHAKQLAAVTENLRAYMSGEYSFADALKELKASRSQLAQREAQVTELTALTNTLRITEDELAEENQLLRARLKLEPHEEKQLPKEITSQRQKRKKIIASLNKRIKVLEEEKLSLKTEVYALSRELSNGRYAVQLTALDLPVKEALTCLTGGLNKEVSEELHLMRQAIEQLGGDLRQRSGRTTAASDGESALGESAVRDARRIITKLEQQFDKLYKKAERRRDLVVSQQSSLEVYREQFRSLQSEVVSISEECRVTPFKDSDGRSESEDRSVESGQVNLSAYGEWDYGELDYGELDYGELDNGEWDYGEWDYGQQFASIDTPSASVADENTRRSRRAESRSQDGSAISSANPSPQRHLQLSEFTEHAASADARARLERNFVAADESHHRVMQAIENLRSQLPVSHSPTMMVHVLAPLLRSLQDERRSTHESLAHALDLQFDAQVMLRQLQINMKHIDQMKEIYSTQQSEQNVAKWCQNFQRQQLANIELKERLEFLIRENKELKKEATAKESQLSDLIQNLSENVQNSSEMMDRNDQTVKNETDVATIAIQTSGNESEGEDAAVARYIAENNEVLGQAITDLDKQRALNANLQRTLIEKELSLISKDQIINKVKSEMTQYNVPPSEPVSSEETPPAFNRFAFVENDLEEIENKRKESHSSILTRYQSLIEKANEDHRAETNKLKVEIGQIVKERDVALRRIKDLQLCLDSIPSRESDGTFHLQQFIDQIQAMTETIRLLEKQLSVTRMEMAETQSKLGTAESKLSEERSRFKFERDKQEVACKKKTQQMELEHKQLMKEAQGYRGKIDELQKECNELKKRASEAPTLVLTALVKKMREKLIEKEKIIAELTTK